MLAGHLTNQDEDEVEDELEALQRELAGPEILPDDVVFPSPPTAEMPVEVLNLILVLIRQMTSQHLTHLLL
jgi:hypothetical protein